LQNSRQEGLDEELPVGFGILVLRFGRFLAVLLGDLLSLCLGLFCGLSSILKQLPPGDSLLGDLEFSFSLQLGVRVELDEVSQILEWVPLERGAFLVSLLGSEV